MVFGENHCPGLRAPARGSRSRNAPQETAACSRPLAVRNKSGVTRCAPDHRFHSRNSRHRRRQDRRVDIDAPEPPVASRRRRAAGSPTSSSCLPWPRYARSQLLTAGRGRIPAWLPPPPVDGVDRFALGPAPGGPLESSWYRISRDRPMGIFVSGAPGSSNALSLEWGRNRRDAIESLRRDPVVIGDGPHDERALPWRFALASELPQAPTDADAVRVVFENRISRGSAVGVSAPVTYASEPLTKQLSDRASSSLIHPAFLPYFPCARQPTIREGVAETPDRILT